MSSNNELINLLESMPYPDDEPHSDAQKKGKIKYILALTKDYKNVDEVIEFINNSTSSTVRDLFEELLDSDLFKGN